jgi:hypothetical protein
VRRPVNKAVARVGTAGSRILVVAGFRYERDIAPAAWIKDRLHPFATDVGAVVPEGFESYGRVLHPAYRDGEPVTWRRIAEANGRTIHPRVQFGGIAGSWRSSGNPDLWTRPPRPGTLPLETATALVGLLRRNTATPERCWFAVWVGWGSLEGADTLPRLVTDQREYYLASGPLESVLRGVYAEPTRYQSPSMWWPDDRAWFVSTEVDLAYTYIGGTRACISGVLAHPAVEATYAHLTDPISWDSDHVNPIPGPPR